MTRDELDLGEFSIYSGGICLDLAPGMPLERAALIADAVNAQSSGRVTDRLRFVERAGARGVDRSTAISLASLLTHEVRHFHDILLTHDGQWLITEGINLSAGLPHTLHSIRNQRACVLPISRWNELSPALHGSLSAIAGRGALKQRPPEHLQARLAGLAQVFEATDYFFKPPPDAPPGAPATPLLFEGLAVGCQLAELRMTGDGEHDLVSEFVRRLDERKARRYIDYFDYVETCAGYTSHPSQDHSGMRQAQVLNMRERPGRSLPC